MKPGVLGNKTVIVSIIGILIGTLLCIVLPHPWIGVVVGVTIGILFGNSTFWKDGARRGVIIGSLIIILAGFVVIPPRIGRSRFAFWDSFFFYLMLGVIGSGVVGGVIGAVISWMRKVFLAKNTAESDFLPGANEH